MRRSLRARWGREVVQEDRRGSDVQFSEVGKTCMCGQIARRRSVKLAR